MAFEIFWKLSSSGLLLWDIFITVYNNITRARLFFYLIFFFQSTEALNKKQKFGDHHKFSRNIMHPKLIKFNYCVVGPLYVTQTSPAVIPTLPVNVSIPIINMVNIGMKT